MKKILFCPLAVILCLLLAGCQSAQLSQVQIEETPVPSSTPRPLPTLNPEADWDETLAFYKRAEERDYKAVAFSAESGFYSQDVTLTLTAEGAADIFYTDDGSEPTCHNLHYEHPISLAVTSAELPRCAVIRAVA